MYIHILGWNSSKPDTIGPEESVLISGVALFSGVEKHTNMAYTWGGRAVLISGVEKHTNMVHVYTCTWGGRTVLISGVSL